MICEPQMYRYWINGISIIVGNFMLEPSKPANMSAIVTAQVGPRNHMGGHLGEVLHIGQ